MGGGGGGGGGDGRTDGRRVRTWGNSIIVIVRTVDASASYVATFSALTAEIAVLELPHTLGIAPPYLQSLANDQMQSSEFTPTAS